MKWPKVGSTWLGPVSQDLARPAQLRRRDLDAVEKSGARLVLLLELVRRPEELRGCDVHQRVVHACASNAASISLRTVMS